VKIKKALDIIIWYSQMILRDKAQMLSDLEESDKDELDSAINKVREFLEEFK
jgi:hypothetical protein